jgi:HPt (histidine-containing phosphotransfer) domain-containing protein
MYEPHHTAGGPAVALNAQRLADVAGADPQFIAEVLEMAVSSLGMLVRRLTGELGENDYERACATAHEIKGVCLNIGADEMGGIAALLQERLQNCAAAPIGGAAQLDGLAAALAPAYDRFVESARTFRRRG